MSTAGALDDYLEELLGDATVVAPAAPAPEKAATLQVPGDSAELEAAFEEALAAAQAAALPVTPEQDSVATPAVASREPTWDDLPEDVIHDTPAAQNTALPDAGSPASPKQSIAAAPIAASREPTWDDLPDEVIYETDDAQSTALAHTDSPSLQAAFDVAAGKSPAPAAARAAPAAIAVQHTTSAARPSTWQELQMQAQRPAEAPTHRRANERTSRWLRMRCGQQTYALELLKVQEVVLPVPLLALRGAGQSMLGIMNLRGQVVPVLDLCRHLGVVTTEEDAQTRIVVLEENGEILGLRVSAVEDVTSLSEAQIEPPDTARICQISNDLFRGIARLGQQPMILLDASRLLQ